MSDRNAGSSRVSRGHGFDPERREAPPAAHRHLLIARHRDPAASTGSWARSIIMSMLRCVAPATGRVSKDRTMSGTRQPLPIVQTGKVRNPEMVRDPEWWVAPIRWSALAVWLSIPAFALLAQPYAGRIVWTVAVASLPLFIVLVGYHRWRRICPLAFINQIPVRLLRPGTRRMPPWVEEHHQYIPLALFVAGLWLRLTATNGDGAAIAAFFVALSLVALVFGAIFTGKSWCQYVCPVSFIEKIYTEPHGLRETRNSQCTTCTACKTACPDINQENSYWKELGSRSKRVAYFAYPGLVFGFYFYYFLQSGTWDYYFSGDWTDEPGLLATAFLPGHDAGTAGFAFLPAVPRALASILTLGPCAGASYLLFSRLEPLVERWRRARH